MFGLPRTVGIGPHYKVQQARDCTTSSETSICEEKGRARVGQKNFRSRGQLENVVHQQEHVVYPNHMHKSETFLKQSET